LSSRREKLKRKIIKGGVTERPASKRVIAITVLGLGRILRERIRSREVWEHRNIKGKEI